MQRDTPEAFSGVFAFKRLTLQAFSSITLADFFLLPPHPGSGNLRS
jgi:hypothetical protein